MTILEIEAFLSIVKHGSISAAAQELYVTQPALSRRIRAVEEELGYRLLKRQKGVRAVALTSQGEAFVAVAKKLRQLYAQAAALSNLQQRPVLSLSSVGSVSTYLLPEVLRAFLREGYSLSFHNHHSGEAYHYVESGLSDIALISDERYSRSVRTVPAFEDPFVLVGGEAFAGRESVHPSGLRAENEVRLPWNPQYDAWHEKWFDGTVYPHVELDQMSLLEEFLEGENWAVVPLTVAKRMRREGLRLCRLQDGPPRRIIYYLTLGREKEELIGHFLALLHKEISGIKGVKSFLGE